MTPAGEAAIGFICARMAGTGTHFPLIQDILTSVYAQGNGAGPESDVGTGHWIRGLLRSLLVAEALRTAMREFGNQPAHDKILPAPLHQPFAVRPRNLLWSIAADLV